LQKYGIRVLPLAQQTMRFNDIDAKTKSTYDTGIADGICNADAFITVFSITPDDSNSYHIFLNIEIDQQTPVNSEYFKGWTVGLTKGVQKAGRKISLLPAVYIGTTGSIESWKALEIAVADLGKPLSAGWIARYGKGYTGKPALKCKDIDRWRDNSQLNNLSFPTDGVGAWQYQENCYVEDRRKLVDVSILNPAPAVRTSFINGLIEPKITPMIGSTALLTH
jgi:hypothetical protein